MKVQNRQACTPTPQQQDKSQKYKLRQRIILLTFISLLTIFGVMHHTNLPVHSSLLPHPEKQLKPLRPTIAPSIVSRHLAFTSLISPTKTISKSVRYEPDASVEGQYRTYLPLIVKYSSTAENPIVVRITYSSPLATPAEAQANLNSLASWLDIWEVDPDTYAIIALVWPEEYIALRSSGYSLEIIPEYDYQLRALDTACYRSVEQLYETFTQTVTANYPDITQLVDYGDSWEKVISGGEQGYDLYALEITNKSVPGPKPAAIIDGGIHAREMTPPEIAMALIDFLTANYNQDPDVTWMIDYHRIVISPVLNPDGRKKAEAGLLWRKNTDNDDGCIDPNRWGTDLNRNFYFKWGCCGGSSADPCASTFRGPAPDSEPEVYYYENLVRNYIPDQWDYIGDLTPPAPLTTTGILVNMHSYDPSILYPWGWTDADALNDADLKAIAEKYSSISGYPTKRSLYRVDGLVRDWGYGDLGIPSFTLEAGTAFFQDCAVLPEILSDNLPALYHFVRIARAPYLLIHGPDVISLTVTPPSPVTGQPVQLSATIDDAQNGGQPVEGAVYYIDVPPWVTTTTIISRPMAAVDGVFDTVGEQVQAEIDIENLSSGRHTVFVQGYDVAGNWGPLWATWLSVNQGWLSGKVFDSQTGEPIVSASLTITNSPHAYATQTDTFGLFTIEIPSSTYTVTATAPNYNPSTTGNVVVQNSLTTTLQFGLLPISPSIKIAPMKVVPTERFTYTFRLVNSGDDEPTTLFDHLPDELEYAGGLYATWGTPLWDGTAVTWSGPLTTDLPLTISFQVNAPQACPLTVSNRASLIHSGEISYSLVATTQVDDQPIANFILPITNIVIDEAAVFTNVSQASTSLRFLWSFGDGITSSEVHPHHLYTQPGTYTVILTASNICGSDIYSDVLTVEPYLIAPNQLYLPLILKDPG